MKIMYEREKDILLIEISDDKIDHAEENDGVIIHFTEDKKPVLLEILDATEFITKVINVGMRKDTKELVKI